MPSIILLSVLFGSPWCPETTIRYLSFLFCISLSFFRICLAYLSISACLDKSTSPQSFAAKQYFAMLLPIMMTFLFSSLPNSAIVFSLAMWLANVVSMSPFPLLSMSIRTSLSMSFATCSLGVFRCSAEYRQSCISASTPLSPKFL